MKSDSGSAPVPGAPTPLVQTLFGIRQEMRSLESGDTEANHSRADDLLIAAIRLLAANLSSDPTTWRADAEDLIASFERMEKWYA